MHADIALVLLVIVFGCAAFLFGLVYIVGGIVMTVGRGIFGMFRPHRLRSGCGVRVSGFSDATASTCPKCHHIDARGGRYCSRCGTRADARKTVSRRPESANWWMS